jgi:predicted acyl esterase
MPHGYGRRTVAKQGSGEEMTLRPRRWTSLRLSGAIFLLLYAIVCKTSLAEAATAATSPSASQPEYAVTVDKDVRIPLRDGSYLAADVYRPQGVAGAKYPVLMSLSAYLKELQHLPHGAPFTHQERPEPQWWASRGYILVFVDTRGTGKSPGKTDIWSAQEARDYYDAIEWAAAQPWSTGKIGLSGVSYYAITQWNVASLQPPHLTTILPWEGWADLYRDSVFHGGLFNQAFYGNWWTDVMGKQLLETTVKDGPDGMNENLVLNFMQHSMDSKWWDEGKARAQMDRLTVPFYSSANWGGWNHHLRGNLETFTRAASKNKKLQVHIGGHTDYFYDEEGKQEQLRWYDYWLKGIETGIMQEPPVKLCIRTSTRECTWRFENEWPLQRTQYKKFFLTPDKADVVKDAIHDVKMAAAAPPAAGVLTYDAGPASAARADRDLPTISFSSEPLAQDTEITGPINLVMWVSSETDDMDLFAFLRKTRPDGKVETATRGILKVSHRKLDTQLSTPARPYHSHDVEQKLRPGEVVKVEVEIWPTSMVYEKGSRIRLDVQPHDGQHYFSAYHLQKNTIYTGADRASYVLLPIVPPGGAGVPGKSARGDNLDIRK